MPKLTQSAIGEHLFLHRSKVSTLIRDGVLPKTGTLDQYRKAYITHLQGVAARHISKDGQLDITAERARLAKEQADKLARENSVAKGELLPADKVAEEWGSQCHRVRNKLLNAGSKLAPLMPGVKSPAEAQDIIDKVLHEALHELSMPK